MSFAGQPGPRRGAVTLFGFVLLVLSASVCIAAETRIALVIGNGAYQEAPLSNPPNDARLIADTLKGLGFTLIGAKPLVDADQKTMKRAIRTFGEELERAGSDGVGLFFYAGHAVQANGKNYLIPEGADIRGEADLEDDAVSADSVLRQMTYAGARVNLVVLDACRTNPYRGRFRSPTRGLAEMSAPNGSLVAYSTAPGDVAEDGTGKNSPYSAALAEAMGIADLPIEQAFKRVGRTVMQTTGNRQVPWYSSSLFGDFYFMQTALVPRPAQQPAEKPLASPVVGTYAMPPRVRETLLTITTPPFDYFLQKTIGRKQDTQLRLVKVSEKPSTSVTYDGWWANNHLDPISYNLQPGGDLPATIPMQFRGERIVTATRSDPVLAIYGKPDFKASRGGEVPVEGRYLLAIDAANGATQFAMDFAAFQIPRQYLQGLSKSMPDQAGMETKWAVLENGILYVSHAHDTYASESKGHNAYLSAINVSSGTLLWRSRPLVSNSSNFLVKGDAIISGYGFTDEKHYVYILNKADGSVAQQILIKKMAQYFVEHDGRLFVQAGDFDYIFSYAHQ